jgi:hypothetical protein
MLCATLASSVWRVQVTRSFPQFRSCVDESAVESSLTAVTKGLESLSGGQKDPFAEGVTEGMSTDVSRPLGQALSGILTVLLTSWTVSAIGMVPDPRKLGID